MKIYKNLSSLNLIINQVNKLGKHIIIKRLMFIKILNNKVSIVKENHYK